MGMGTIRDWSACFQTFRRSSVGSSGNLVKLDDEISPTASDKSSIAGNECRSEDMVETLLRQKAFCGVWLVRKCSSIADTKHTRRTSVEACRDSSGALLGIAGWLHSARVATRKVKEVNFSNYENFRDK